MNWNNNKEIKILNKTSLDKRINNKKTIKRKMKNPLRM